MTTQLLPNIRAFVDWDGDGWINKGAVTDPLNLSSSPLKMQDLVKVNTTMATQKYFRSTRGLYESTFLYLNTNVLYIGYNKGSAGQYVPMLTPTQTGTYTAQLQPHRHSQSYPHP
jgi:hypothetical protein